MLENLDFFTLLSFILIASLLFIGLVRSYRISYIIKGILSWISIAMILIILYAFRSELNYFYHRTLAVLIPFYTWVDNDDKQTIAIARQNDGHFYINTVVNNVPIRFMIDTGATGIALTKQDAIKLGINLKTLEYNKAHSTANGITYSAKVTLKSLRIENTVFSDIKAHVSQGNLDVSLLGMSVISRFKSFTIDQDLLYITPDL